MKKLQHIILLLASAILILACTSEKEEEGVVRPLEISIPISVCQESGTILDTRGTGDPGIMEALPEPVFLYIWLDIVKSDDTHTLHFYKESNIKWVKKNVGTTSECWECTRQLQVPAGVTVKSGSTLQVYAVASLHELSFITYADAGALNEATLDLSEWPNSTASAHSYALGNLYSTPLALMGNGNDDATAAGITAPNPLLNNGTYTATIDADHVVRLSPKAPTRLYHCAAKADFKWEVATALQPGVSVSTITIKDLPTTLKVFDPTHNEGGSGTCTLLAASSAVNTLNDGNKWLGREYAYVLQPPTPTHGGDGTLHYSVTFTGRTPDTNNTPADKQTSPATNPVFTTWYRINADIKN